MQEAIFAAYIGAATILSMTNGRNNRSKAVKIIDYYLVRFLHNTDTLKVMIYQKLHICFLEMAVNPENEQNIVQLVVYYDFTLDQDLLTEGKQLEW